MPAIQDLRESGFIVKTETKHQELFKKLKNKQLPLVYCIVTSKSFVLDLKIIELLERMEHIVPVIVYLKKIKKSLVKKLPEKCIDKGAMVAKDSKELKKQLMGIMKQDVPTLLQDQKSKRKLVILYSKKSQSIHQNKTYFLNQGIEFVFIKSRKKVFQFLLKNPCQVKCLVTCTGPVLERGSTFLYELKNLVCDLKIIVFSASVRGSGQTEIRNKCKSNKYVDDVPQSLKHFKERIVEYCTDQRKSFVGRKPKKTKKKKHSKRDHNSHSNGKKNKTKHNKEKIKKKREQIQIIWVSQASNTILKIQKKIKEKNLYLKNMNSIKEVMRYLSNNPKEIQIIICNVSKIGHTIQNKLGKNNSYIDVFVYDLMSNHNKKRKKGSLKIINSKKQLIQKIYKKFDYDYDYDYDNNEKVEEEYYGYEDGGYNNYSSSSSSSNSSSSNCSSSSIINKSNNKKKIIVLDSSPYQKLINDLVGKGLNVITVDNIKKLKRAIKGTHKKIKVIITSGSFIIKGKVVNKVDDQIPVLIFSKSGYQKEFIKNCKKWGAKFVSNDHQSIVDETMKYINKEIVHFPYSVPNNPYDNDLHESQKQSQPSTQLRIYPPYTRNDPNQVPRIETVSKSKFKDIERQFLYKWEHKPPNIAGIFRVVPPKHLSDAYHKYQKQICNKFPRLDVTQKTVGKGNERRRFHAADYRCNFGLNGNTRFCNNPECSVCRVCKDGFSSQTESFFYSKGEIYCTASAFQALVLSSQKNTTHVAIFVVTVICGNPIYIQEETQKIPEDPQSLVLDFGKHKDVTVVFSKFHIVPKYLILFN
ncbi:c2h2-like zinc finger protein [Anaeramoeba flamelloides]|uniref:C2h2-like zinc finger protein n=1 Tax=Anaeramoeba flamelloides TaxID=1746091 RepID=A0AAV7YIJ7_9EUKA|nr:c2h2-like zinc finger protein [Anaeramoeba flamelloides]